MSLNKQRLKIIIDYFGSGITLLGFLKKYKINKGDVVIDAGAYLGHFTLMAAKKVGKTGMVIAFEPSPSNFKSLEERVRNSDLKNIILINKALFNIKTKLFFSEEIASDSVYSFQKNSKNIIKVKTTTIDFELSKLNIKKVDFIKMDIEGAEIEALDGGKEILKKTSNFAIACYHKRNNVTTDNIMLPVLKKMKFKISRGFFIHPTLYGQK